MRHRPARPDRAPEAAVSSALRSATPWMYTGIRCGLSCSSAALRPRGQARLPGCGGSPAPVPHVTRRATARVTRRAPRSRGALSAFGLARSRSRRRLCLRSGHSTPFAPGYASRRGGGGPPTPPSLRSPRVPRRRLPAFGGGLRAAQPRSGPLRGANNAQRLRPAAKQPQRQRQPQRQQQRLRPREGASRLRPAPGRGVCSPGIAPLCSGASRPLRAAARGLRPP
jgi:hypothetical protein